MPQKDLTKLFQLSLNETTLFKLQVRDEKKNSDVKKIASSVSSSLPCLLLARRIFTSADGGVSGTLIPVLAVYFSLSSFGI